MSAAPINDSSPNTDQTKQELTGEEAFPEQISPEVSVQPEEVGKTELSVESTESSDGEAQPEEELLGKGAEPEVPSIAVTPSVDEENAEVKQTTDNEHALNHVNLLEEEDGEDSAPTLSDVLGICYPDGISTRNALGVWILFTPI